MQFRGVVINFIPKITYTELLTGTPKTVIFSSPPEGDPFSESYNHVKKSRRTTSGVMQTQFNYNLKKYKLKFIFQVETVKTAFNDFILNHASRGSDFKYYMSSDEVDYEVFEYTSRSYKLSRPIPATILGQFEYDLTFNIERVV